MLEPQLTPRRLTGQYRRCPFTALPEDKSSEYDEKIYNNYALIVDANSLLLILGLTRMITLSLSALLRNLTTIGTSAYSLTPVLNIKNENKTREQKLWDLSNILETDRKAFAELLLRWNGA